MNLKTIIISLFIGITATGCNTNIGQEYNWHPDVDTTPQKVVELVYENELSNHLFAQSVAGVTHKALKAGESDYGVWLNIDRHMPAYQRSYDGLKALGAEIEGKPYTTANILDNPEIKAGIKGYILTDIDKNPESAVYATVASHVYDAAIVDIKELHLYEKYESFELLCDARAKRTTDAWAEFRDKCDNSALVVMPVSTAQLRDFAITHQLFVINLNMIQGDPSKGQNAQLLEEVLSWLKPNSPVYGWESGVGEDVFVDKVSEYGHMMVPSDWAHNLVLSSLNYQKQQVKLEYSNKYPAAIDFDDNFEKYVSYYLSDGDNVQWMINGFENENYYLHPLSSKMRMGYGVAAANLSMMAPAHYKELMKNLPAGCTAVETFGGGYYYVDTFGKRADRESALNSLTKKVAIHMQNSGLRILALIAKDIDCKESKEAYAKYIENNNQLDGIIAIQYSPYAGGNGEIMWFENKEGIDIPVITAKYTIWDFGANNHPLEGTPTYVANKINNEVASDSPFSLLSVHAWSSFADAGINASETDEATMPNKNIRGAGAADLCTQKLNRDTKIVSVEELFWRVRMHYRPSQTKKIRELRR